MSTPDRGNPREPRHVLALSSPPKWISVAGKFDDTCVINVSGAALAAAEAGRLAVSLRQIGPLASISELCVDVDCRSGTLALHVGASGVSASFGKGSSGIWNLSLWDQSSVRIGPNTSSNGTRIVADRSDVEIGQDGLFSDGVLIQSADQHGIVDLATREIINNRRRRVLVGDHVWLGRQCILMPDVSIGRGSIVGTGSVVTSDVPDFSVAAGVPARIVRSGTTWTRARDTLDVLSTQYVAESSGRL